MLKNLLTVLVIAAALVTLGAQNQSYISWSGSGAPSGTCAGGSMYFDTAGLNIYGCNAGSWVAAVKPGVPQGAVLLVATGACPSGYTELAAANGRMLVGTVTANGNVGTTGGADNITPAGTIGAPTISWPAGVPAFTGSSATTSLVSAGTPAGTNGTSATTGNCAATNLAIGTGATTACKATAPNLTVSAQTFTGSALGTHSHTLTATGTVAWPAGVPTNSTPAFTGTQFDNRSAFLRVIPCVKD